MFIADKTRSSGNVKKKGGRCGRDKQLKLQVKDSHTLGGAGEGDTNGEGSEKKTRGL